MLDYIMTALQTPYCSMNALQGITLLVVILGISLLISYLVYLVVVIKYKWKEMEG